MYAKNVFLVEDKIIAAKRGVRLFGKSRQFKNYLQENWRDMYRLAYAWTHDNALASDLVQETITRCLKNSAKFTNTEDVRIWLFKVMKNCWRDHLRKQKPQVDIQDIEIQGSTNLEHEHYRNQIMRHVKKAFKLLSTEHREILSLVVMEEFSYEMVAEILDIPTGTVMSRVSRARHSLRGHLHDGGFTQENSESTLWRVK